MTDSNEEHPKDDKVYFCSFCAESIHQALAMIMLPHGVNICNYCIGECNKLMAERHGIFCQPRAVAISNE